jgi:hypothetical protein
MIAFATESVSQVLDEIEPLLHDHWEEVAVYKDKIPLAPDYDAYRRLEADGKLLICTARDDGKLVGYSISFVHRGVHYSKNIIATNDLVYIDPENRQDSMESIERDLVFDDLIDYAEEKLKARGVSVIVLRIKVSKNWSARAEQHGYPRVEYIHQKYVGA